MLGDANVSVEDSGRCLAERMREKSTREETINFVRFVDVL